MRIMNRLQRSHWFIRIFTNRTCLIRKVLFCYGGEVQMSGKKPDICYNGSHGGYVGGFIII